MLGAINTRRPRLQNRAVLAGVEMMPTAHGLMIVERALGAALGTGPAHLFLVFKQYMHLAFGSAQL